MGMLFEVVVTGADVNDHDSSRVLETVPHNAHAQGFAGIPKRWIFEHTFSLDRSLPKDGPW